jgi:hypothetical protein
LQLPDPLVRDRSDRSAPTPSNVEEVAMEDSSNRSEIEDMVDESGLLNALAQ